MSCAGTYRGSTQKRRKTFQSLRMPRYFSTHNETVEIGAHSGYEEECTETHSFKTERS